MQAEHVIWFIENLTLTGGHLGKPFKLRDWQKDILNRLFAEDADGKRIIQRALLLLPKGNGKTEIISALVLYFLVCFPPGQNIVSIACDRTQASLVFDAARTMVEADEFLASVITVVPSQKRLVVESRHSFYVALSCDHQGKGKHGLKPSVVIADELSKYRTPALVNALQGSMAKRDDPLWISISTADRANPHAVGYREYIYAKRVLSGDVIDPHYLPVIYGADETDDWEDEQVWCRCNPALGDFLNLDVLRHEFKLAKEIPGKRFEFMCDHLNVWTGEAHHWIDMAVWDEGNQPVEIPDGAEVYLGLDLAIVHDLTSLSILWRDEKTYHVQTKVYCAEGGIDRRSEIDKVPYRSWRDAGFLVATPGNSTDHGYVKNEIVELSKKYRIKCLAADQKFAHKICQELVEEYDIPVFWHGQFAVAMNLPTLELEKMVVDRSLRHGGHPVLRWCASNTVVERTSSNLTRPVKDLSTERIDCVVSLIFAIGAMLAEPPDEGPSFYESHGIEFF